MGEWATELTTAAVPFELQIPCTPEERLTQLRLTVSCTVLSVVQASRLVLRLQSSRTKDNYKMPKSLVDETGLFVSESMRGATVHWAPGTKQRRWAPKPDHLAFLQQQTLAAGLAADDKHLSGVSAFVYSFDVSLYVKRCRGLPYVFAVAQESAGRQCGKWVLLVHTASRDLSPFLPAPPTIPPGFSLCRVCSARTTMRCGGCRNVFYCSPEHAKADWKEHKRVCRKKHATSL
jgi:hypothetical protein